MSERLRELAGKELAVRLPEHLGRLGWDRARLEAHQRGRLRELLARAAANSPFHARRLAGIGVDRFEPGDLPRLPVMTKAELMSQFDDVVTDRRLTLRRVQAHLDASKDSASLLLDTHVCLATGGSSGVRAVFVQTVGEYMDYMASFIRPGVARNAAAGARPDDLVVAVVAAPSPVHSSGLATAAISGPVRLVSVPATLPLADMVRRLNDLQPPALTGYPTMLAVLAAEQRAGRLRIAPTAVTTASEQLTEEDRAAITGAFGVPVTDLFCAAEGLIGHTEPGGRVLTFATDMCVAELVDAGNQPVPPGATADKVLLTNLHNFTQPLIRYELTDRFTRQPDDPAGRLRATVEGRAEYVFRYGDVAVHPRAFDTALDGEPAVTEYQVRQTRHGAVIDVVADGRLDRAALAAAIRGAVERSGLWEPEIEIRVVPSIDRHPDSGKVLRFIPGRRSGR
jgi:phenylacetate-CoA ligase